MPEIVKGNDIVNVPVPIIGVCNEFIPPEEKDKPAGAEMQLASKTVVITPLRLTRVSESSQKFSFGCNWWKSCQNNECSFCQQSID